MIEFTLCSRGGERKLCFEPSALVIAGWTGRDSHAVEEHIRELAALGVPRPVAVPMFYRVAASTLTSAERVEVAGTAATGEVECVVLSTDEGCFVGVGSDHTDRQLERQSVTLSKQACPKPIGRSLWPFEEVADHWDAMALRSYAIIDGKRRAYQDGVAAALRPPQDLIAAFTGGLDLPVGMAMFCGTLPVKGDIEFAERFEIELHDPVLNRSLKHAYDLVALPLNG